MTKEARKLYARAYYLRNAEKLRAYSHTYYRKNLVRCRAYTNRHNLSRAAKKRAFVDAHKGSTPCVDCGHVFPSCCMDYDHLPGKGKLATVSQMVGNHRYSTEDIRKEMSKCELVCANCHRIRTHLKRKMPKNSAPSPSETSAENERVSKAGACQDSVRSPFNYSIDEETERAKAMERQDYKVPNDPGRPII